MRDKIDASLQDELVKKYRLAGRIRWLSFCLLLFFLLLMKSLGGYPHINKAFMALIFMTAVLNQPYSFMIRGTNIYRLQYYHMLVDIIVISYVLYYLGGLEAPVVSILYYVVILWAGVVSTSRAVFFAAAAAAIFLSSFVALEYVGILPFISNFHYKMPLAQMLGLLLGNVSFLFAFGYFSARSSSMIKFLERKRQEELLRYEHKLLVSGYLVGSTAHDTLNHLANIKGYAKLLLDKAKEGSQEREILNSIKSLGERGIELLSRLASFSRESRQEFEAVNINKVIEDAIGLTWPLLKYSQVNIEKALASDIPVIMADKEQLQEVFVILILNALDGASGKTTLKIKTNYLAQSGVVEIVFADTGLKLKDEDLGRRGLDLSLTNAYGIISGHNGKIEIESAGSKGATFIIKLPLKPI